MNEIITFSNKWVNFFWELVKATFPQLQPHNIILFNMHKTISKYCNSCLVNVLCHQPPTVWLPPQKKNLSLLKKDTDVNKSDDWSMNIQTNF